MTPVRTAIALFLLMVGFSQEAYANNTDAIVGHWRCIGENRQTYMAAEVEYVPNGDLNIVFELIEEQDDVKFEIFGVAVGAWEIDDDMLIEKTKDLVVHRLVVNDEKLSDEDAAPYIDHLKTMMTQTSTATEIVKLDDDVMILDPADGESPLVKCTPRP